MTIEPLEPESRIRVKGRHGNIVGIKSIDPLIYLVEFDNDVVYKPTKKNPDAHYKVKRELAHNDITAVLFGEPESYRVAVEPALFLEMQKATDFEDIPGHSSWYSSDKKEGRKGAQGTAVQNPVLWNERYWIGCGAGVRLHDGKGWYATAIRLFPLIPLADYSGELKTPRRYFDGYDGFLVVCALGKFVVEDKPVTVYPSERVYFEKEDDDADDEPEPEIAKTKPKARKVTKRAARAETPGQTEPKQMAFIEIGETSRESA